MMDFESEIEFEDDRTNTSAKVTLKWTVDFECRSWGIKAIEISVPSQEITVDGIAEDKDSLEETPVFFKFPLEEVVVDWEDAGGSILPIKLFWDNARRRFGKINPGWVVEFAT